MRHINIEATKQLQLIINERPLSYNFAVPAIRLVYSGADPNIKNYEGKSLLHLLTKKHGDVHGRHYDVIKKLVKTYHANIDIQDNEGFTPLQCLMKKGLDQEATMTLVRLGADPDTAYNGKFLLDRLRHKGAIEELNQLRFKKYQKQRSNYLNLLIIIALEINNPNPKYYFSWLPMELLFHIINFLNFDSMGKTWKEGLDLAIEVFRQHEEVKRMSDMPGGINVFQSYNETKKSQFTLFKSVQILCHDYDRLKTSLKETQHHKNPIFDKITRKEFTNSSVAKLNEFRDRYAIQCWKSHSALYDKLNKEKLLKSIEEHDLFNEIKSKLHF